MHNCVWRPRVVCEETVEFIMLLHPGERKQSSLFPMWVKRLGTLFWFRPSWECATWETGMCVREEANIATCIGDVIVLVWNDEWCACNGLFVLWHSAAYLSIVHRRTLIICIISWLVGGQVYECWISPLEQNPAHKCELTAPDRGCKNLP